jgi:Asp/Glu/hydantoin racemase
MRICVQSGTPLSQSELYKPYHDSLLRHAARVASPGTTVEFPNLGKQYPGAARSRTHLHLVQHETIKAAVRAQAEGYDVFVTQCLDLGYHELREMVDIPVVFMTQATLAFYAQLAPNFAFLVNSERLLHYFGELADRYKVRERMVPGDFVTFAFTDYANLWNQPEPFIKSYQQVAGTLARRGAAALYPAGLYLSQWLIDQGIRSVEGSLVMDPLAVAIRTAEAMVHLRGLGIEHYRTGAWASPSDDVREFLKTQFGPPT